MTSIRQSTPHRTADVIGQAAHHGLPRPSPRRIRRRRRLAVAAMLAQQCATAHPPSSGASPATEWPRPGVTVYVSRDATRTRKTAMQGLPRSLWTFTNRVGRSLVAIAPQPGAKILFTDPLQTGTDCDGKTLPTSSPADPTIPNVPGVVIVAIRNDGTMKVCVFWSTHRIHLNGTGSAQSVCSRPSQAPSLSYGPTVHPARRPPWRRSAAVPPACGPPTPTAGPSRTGGVPRPRRGGPPPPFAPPAKTVPVLNKAGDHLCERVLGERRLDTAARCGRCGR